MSKLQTGTQFKTPANEIVNPVEIVKPRRTYYVQRQFPIQSNKERKKVRGTSILYILVYMNILK